MQITVEVNSRLLCDDAARDRIITTLAETYVASIFKSPFTSPDEAFLRNSIGEACDRGIRIGMALVLGGTEAAEAVARRK